MNSILLHDASVQRFSIHSVWGAYGEEKGGVTPAAGLSAFPPEITCCAWRVRGGYHILTRCLLVV